MKFKTKLIIKQVFILALGAVITALGAARSGLLMSMGIALLCCGAAQGVLCFLRRNRMQELEALSCDEREAFIARKSYSFAFWLSIVAEFAAVCALLFFGADERAMIINYVICFQALAYALSLAFYRMKY